MRIILVEPQMGENIGAVARVMSNFGFDDLVIVNPRDGWPNEKAYNMSAHGSFVLDKAQIVSSINEAVNDLNYVVATCARSRDISKKVLPNLSDDNINAVKDLNIGIMFGRESTGLNNNEINLANAIYTIPTSDKNKSLNLAQAVCVCLYQVQSLGVEEVHNNNVADRKEFNKLMNFLNSTLEETDYFINKNKQQEQSFIKVYDMFLRANMTKEDINMLYGIIKSIRKS